MSRKSARTAAVQMVYEQMLGGQGGDETLVGLIGFVPEEGDRAYLDAILSGVTEQTEALEALIERNLKGWTVSRLARVDRAILLVAAYEMAFARETPEAVVINEAVSLAQRFDSPQAGKFVNGVLAGVLAELQGQSTESSQNESDLSEKEQETHDRAGD